MKIGRTLLVLGAIAGIAYLERTNGRKRGARIGRPLARDVRKKGTLGRTVRTVASYAKMVRPLREFSPWSILPALLAARHKRNTSLLTGLAGKVVLITGGSRGFGLALAQEFARHGAKIILTARDAEELARAQEKLLALGLTSADVSTIPCDLTDEEQARKMIATATREFGGIDILVINAGIISVGPVENQPVDAFKSAMESNYYTMLHTTLAVLPQMLARRSGSIVNITSIGGKLAVPHLLPYSASKFAALGFSQGLHAELRSKGIRVTSVCPGLMRTGSQTHALFTGDREREYRWFSMGASLPGISISARAAAKKVVRATILGRTEITITPQAILAATFAQALPETTATVMHWVNSTLPQPTGDASAATVPGKDVRGKELTPLIPLGRAAAQRYNEA
jgi:short-subunit dehydrogenase